MSDELEHWWKVSDKEWEEATKLFMFRVKPQHKKTILNRTARKARALNRQRLRDQRNLDGSSFAPRKSGAKTKMLRRVLRGSGDRNRNVQIESSDIRALITVPNPVARKHHFGESETVQAITSHEDLLKYQAKYKKGVRSDSDTSTIRTQKPSKDQIRALREEVGFKIAVWRRNENFSAATAGFILRSHRARHGQSPKQSWEIKYEERHVLGLTPRNNRDLFEYFVEQIEKMMFNSSGNKFRHKTRRFSPAMAT